MNKKQSRRSISVRGTTYDALRSYCERHGVSMSEVVEERIASFLSGSASRPTLKQPKHPVSRVMRSRAAEIKLSFDELHDAARCYVF